jgi:hypothetical protein
MSFVYPPPLDRLLRLGKEPAHRRTWPDYRNLGLENRHVPLLIQMAADPGLHAAPEKAPEVWAPVHAWRALGQMEAADAAGPLLALLVREADNPWVLEEVPASLGMIGLPVIPGATDLLFDEDADERLREAAARIITEVGHEYPDRRDEAAALLTQQLRDWPHQDRTLNAYIIAYLVELNETAAVPLMEEAYAAGAVDLAVHGDWEDVQVDLGMLPERLTPPTPGSYFAPDAPHAPQLARRAPADADAKAKARQKAAKQSRKKNRKKK